MKKPIKYGIRYLDEGEILDTVMARSPGEALKSVVNMVNFSARPIEDLAEQTVGKEVVLAEFEIHDYTERGEFCKLLALNGYKVRVEKRPSGIYVFGQISIVVVGPK